MKKNLFDLLEAGIPAMSADAEGQLRGGFTTLMGGMGAIDGVSNGNCDCNCDNCHCDGTINGNCDCDCGNCGCQHTNPNCNCGCTKAPSTPTPKPATEIPTGFLPGLGNTLLF